MRMLRPDRVFVLPSGLWILDALQPVAVVLDPAGEVLRLVSWREVPPAPSVEEGEVLRVRSDGAALWTQQTASGPLVRVGVEGVSVAVWTDGLLLAACGPGVAWCAAAPPVQELVAGPDPHPLPGRPPGGRLLRVQGDGGCAILGTGQPVRAVRADEVGLLVQVDVEGWGLRPLGSGVFEVVRPTRWLRLPWDVDPPGQLTVAEHGLPEGFVPDERADGGGWGPFSWFEDPAVPEDDDVRGHVFFTAGHEFEGTVLGEPPDEMDRPPVDAADQDLDLAGSDRLSLELALASLRETPVSALGLDWKFGWVDGRWSTGRKVLASASTADGRELRRWELGVGTVVTVAEVGERLAVVVWGRGGWGAAPPGGRVVVLDPASADLTVLLGEDSVDITELCWPVQVQPLETDSYLARTLDANSTLETYWLSEPDGSGATDVSPLARGMSDVRTKLVGGWPHTHLEWTFRQADFPGLVLRRRVPMFDELGRIDWPGHAAIQLMEDLDTGDVPPAGDARDGVLDV